MRISLLRATTVAALALLAGVGSVTAQSNQNPNPDQAGAEEVKAKAADGHATADAPLVNGALTANGTPPTDLVPAKYSAKNDADDKIPVWGYIFKDMTGDQRSAIRRSVLGDRRPTGGAEDRHAKVGVELPVTADLKPLPSEITAQMPRLGAYRYTTSSDKVLLVEPVMRAVVAVIPD